MFKTWNECGICNYLFGSFVKEHIEFTADVETDPVIVAVGVGIGYERHAHRGIGLHVVADAVGPRVCGQRQQLVNALPSDELRLELLLAVQAHGARAVTTVGRRAHTIRGVAVASQPVHCETIISMTGSGQTRSTARDICDPGTDGHRDNVSRQIRLLLWHRVCVVVPFCTTRRRRNYRRRRSCSRYRVLTVLRAGGHWLSGERVPTDGRTDGSLRRLLLLLPRLRRCRRKDGQRTERHTAEASRHGAAEASSDGKRRRVR